MARSCVPLGLMHDEEPELSIFSSRRFRRGFMTPVTEDWDREERRAVMYYVICILTEEVVSANADGLDGIR
jgi:hypothetical protein